MRNNFTNFMSLIENLIDLEHVSIHDEYLIREKFDGVLGKLEEQKNETIKNIEED